jgi:hypothetical protein
MVERMSNFIAAPNDRFKYVFLFRAFTQRHCSPILLFADIDAGKKILIRLRPSRNPGTFYPMEQLVRVMLHELTHNVHGPHDEHFYSFLDKLEDEYDTLALNGWQGSGFYAPGEKLGGSRGGFWGGRKLGGFDTDGRRRALDAVEARQRAEAFGSGGRLGGSKTTSQRSKTRQELAAEVGTISVYSMNWAHNTHHYLRAGSNRQRSVGSWMNNLAQRPTPLLIVKRPVLLRTVLRML